MQAPPRASWTRAESSSCRRRAGTRRSSRTSRASPARAAESRGRCSSGTAACRRARSTTMPGTRGETWVDGGLRGPEDYRASTGLGGFKVSYDAEPARSCAIDAQRCGRLPGRDRALHGGLRNGEPGHGAGPGGGFGDQQAAAGPARRRGCTPGSGAATTRRPFMQDFQDRGRRAPGASGSSSTARRRYWEDLGSRSVKVSVPSTTATRATTTT